MTLFVYIIAFHQVEAQGLPCGWKECCKATYVFSPNTICTTHTLYRVALRAGTTDMHVFKQIFVEHFLQDMVMAAPKDTEYILVRTMRRVNWQQKPHVGRGGQRRLQYDAVCWAVAISIGHCCRTR